MFLRHALCVVDIGEVVNSLFRLDHRPLNRHLQSIQPNFLGGRIQTVVNRLGLFVPTVNEIPPRDLDSQHGKRLAIYIEDLVSGGRFEMRHEVMAEGDLPDVASSTYS